MKMNPESFSSLWAVRRSDGADALGVYDDVDDDVYAARLERWLKVRPGRGSTTFQHTHHLGHLHRSAQIRIRVLGTTH